MEQTALTMLMLNPVCYLCRWPYANTRMLETDLVHTHTHRFNELCLGGKFLLTTLHAA